MDYSVLFDLIITRSEANEVIRQLEALAESLYEIKNSVEENMDKILTQEVKEALRRVCRENGVDFKNVLAFQKFLENLKEALASLPAAKLTFAFEPKAGTVKKIAVWLENNLKEKVLIETEVNPAIVGGLLIEFKGNYKDYSLRNKLEVFFQKTNFTKISNFNSEL